MKTVKSIKQKENNMKRKLRELFSDVYDALKDLMYSNMIDTETFIKLDKLVKTPLFNIFQELYENKKNKNSRKRQ